MKYRFLYLTFLLFISGTIAQASVTEDRSYGLFEHPWFIDGLQTYSFKNPAHLYRFKNIAYAERYGFSDGETNGGITYEPVANTFFAVYFGNAIDTDVWNGTSVTSLFHKDTYSIKAVSKYPTSSGGSLSGYQFELLDGTLLDITDPQSDLREPLKQRNANLAFAFNTGSFAMGIDFGYASTWQRERKSQSDTYDTYNLINTDYSSNIGMMLIVNQVFSIDFLCDFEMLVLDNNFKRNAPGINAEMTYGSDMAMDIDTQLRFNYQMTDRHRMHFNLGYVFINHSTTGSMKIEDKNDPTKNVDAKDTFARNGQKISFGISDEFPLSDNLKAFLGFNTEVLMLANSYSGSDSLAPANNQDKYSNTYQSISVPMIIGLQGNLTENWICRFGLVQIVYQPTTSDGDNITNSISGSSTTTPTTLDENSSSATKLSMGLSYNINGFRFDWLVNADLVTVGPYFVSGKGINSEPNTMATSFAVTYNFDTLLE